jgi:DNA processing protein
LAHEIAAGGGCLLSEFPLDSEPLPGHFPRRNRIVAGLCWATVVVEGCGKSGSLITARLAAQQGREVFAVPGPADSALSEAPLRLISQGAKMARSMADIWPELPPGCQLTAPAVRNSVPPAPAEPPIPPASAPLTDLLAQRHEKILQLLGSETRSVAELGAESGLDISSLTRTLFELELQDLVEAVPGQRYAKKNS